ncbi:MAG: hypothetical protein CL917_19430 [Deltaproteobacteria bacterium]|nr:hypothetical protein [Deltaproteobacteria bacterium]
MFSVAKMTLAPLTSKANRLVWRALLFIVGSTLVSLFAPSVGSAHGGLDFPATRSYVCRFLDIDSEMCAQAWAENPQALYDWMEINIGNAGGVHQPRIPDGELCSAGRSKYGALNTPGDWPVTTLEPNAQGAYDMSFIPHAPHATEYFRFYLTREGFDPETESLAWEDLELVHDSGPISYDRMASEGNDFGFEMDLPERPGRHILYLVWQRSDSLEAFYGCSDIQFSSFADQNPSFIETPQVSAPSDSSESDSMDMPSMPMPMPMPMPEDGVSDLHVSLTSSSDWGAGYCADGTVTNHSHSEVVWETQLQISGEMVSSWDSEISQIQNLTGSTSTYTVRGAAWNQTLPPHGSANFGFCVNRSTDSSEIAMVVPSPEPPSDGASNPPPEAPSSPDSSPSDPNSTPAETSPTETSPPTETANTTPPPATNPTESPVQETGSPNPQGSVSSNDSKPILAAYYPEWGIYGRDYFIADIPGDELTHVIYAFVDLSASGQITLFDPWAATDRVFTGDQSVSGATAATSGNFGQITELKALYPHLRFSIAVGGWTLSTHFSSVLSTPEGRETASDAVIDFLRQYEMFDGVDFDWEYPGGGGLASNGSSPNDGTHYALFLAEVRTKIDALGEERGRVYEISVASPGGYDKIANFNLPGLTPSVDFYNVMTYDFHGTWENTTGHQAAFQADANGYDIRTSIDLYLEAGVPASKIVLGSPIYTRAWAGVADGGNGGYGQPSSNAAPGSFFDQPGMYDYKDLANQWLEGAGDWELYWDDQAGAAYLYSANLGIFSSFESPGTVAFKSEWAQHMGLRGIMFWDLSSDTRNPSERLTRAAARSWFGGLEFDEIVAESNFSFDRIVGGNQTFDPFVESPTEPSDITHSPVSPPETGPCVSLDSSSEESSQVATNRGKARRLNRIKQHRRGRKPPVDCPASLP